MLGLLMWRAGLMLAAATGLYRTTRFLLQFVDLPMQLEIGAGLIFSGVVVFMASIIGERYADIRAEGDLNQ